MGFECRILADSVAPTGARLTTVLAAYPRAIHSEIMTHKLLSKSSASSRAIPVLKLIERIEADPWIPDYIGKNQKGMQPGEELTDSARNEAVNEWLAAKNDAVAHARTLHAMGVHKGVVNRAIEPWMWITVVISATDLDNFFGLRDHEMAEPHFQHFARMFRKARDESTPVQLEAGQWHLPFVLVDEQDNDVLGNYLEKIDISQRQETLRKISVGRTARVSYLNHDGKFNPEDDIRLHDDLMVKRPLHAAPAEHIAKAMGWPKWFKDSYDCSTMTPSGLRSMVVAFRKERKATGRRPTGMEFDQEACLGELQSGNYLGFEQYRKMLIDEHIGGLMP